MEVDWIGGNGNDCNSIRPGMSRPGSIDTQVDMGRTAMGGTGATVWMDSMDRPATTTDRNDLIC
jgi:hypothetical protein